MDIKITYDGVTVEVTGVPTTEYYYPHAYDQTPYDKIESVIVSTIKETLAKGGEK